MPNRPPTGDSNATLLPLPMDEAIWKTIADRLALSSQQTRIVEQILCGKQDKEVASTLGLTVPTIRTYMKRIYARTGTNDRLTLVLHVFAMAQKILSSG